MTASIVVPVLNNWHLTEQCLLSLRTTAPAAGLVVVDNGSTDDTLANLTSNFRDVLTIHNTQNRGFAKACNQGAKYATGQVVAFLNNDVVAHPGWLEPLLAALEDGAMIAGSLLLFPNGTVQHGGMAVRGNLQWCHLYGGMDPDCEPGIRRPKDLQAVTGACMAIRRDDFANLGGFDEAYVNGYEDVDLCCRARKAGGRIRYEPRSILTHYEGQTEGRFDSEPKNIARFYGKWRRDIRPDYERIIAEDRA